MLALAGTDKHPFQRMVDWIDEAALRRTDVRFVIQHGTTAPPRTAQGHSFLAHDKMASLMAEAKVVVCHGGPGLIMEAREAGHLPLCLPRNPALGEHVDGHQQRFAVVVNDGGVVRTVATATEFQAELDKALITTASPGAALAGSSERAQARASLAAELDSLMIEPKRSSNAQRSFGLPRGLLARLQT